MNPQQQNTRGYQSDEEPLDIWEQASRDTSGPQPAQPPQPPAGQFTPPQQPNPYGYNQSYQQMNSSVQPDPLQQPPQGWTMPTAQQNPLSQQTTALSAPQTEPDNDKSSKLPWIIGGGIGLVLLLFIGGVIYAIISTSGSQNEQQESVHSAAEDSGRTKTPQVVTLGDSVIVDDEMGYAINATELRINEFDIPKKYASEHLDKTVVLVKFANTDSGKFAGSASNLTLNLVTPDKTVIPSTDLSDNHIIEENYTPLTLAPEEGNVVEGYLVYWVPSDKLSNLSLQYKRLGAAVFGTTESIPAKDFEIPLK